jgi:type VI secretion system protein ImpM
MSFVGKHKVNSACFGKIPARADFVKNTTHTLLLNSLDSWVSEAMEQLGRDPQWKALYDVSTPLRFAFLGSRSKLAIAGYICPCHDHSSRRFPFLCAASLTVPNSQKFMMRSPMKFGTIWNAIEQTAQTLTTCAEAPNILESLENMANRFCLDPDGDFDAFLDQKNIEDIVAIFKQQGHDLNFHDVVLGLGLLLEPVIILGVSQTNQGLLLPLSLKAAERNLILTFWLSLIAPFLVKGDFEVALFVGVINGLPRLAIGFRGASPEDLSNLMSTSEHVEQSFICLDKSPWVMDQFKGETGKYKLSSYLQQPGLSLRTLYKTFHEVFTGA